jgi:DNA polymerase sigma
LSRPNNWNDIKLLSLKASLAQQVVNMELKVNEHALRVRTVDKLEQHLKAMQKLEEAQRAIGFVAPIFEGVVIEG